MVLCCVQNAFSGLSAVPGVAGSVGCKGFTRTLGLRLGLDMTARVTSMGVVFGVSVYQRASD
jgi:hypothetical protein